MSNQSLQKNSIQPKAEGKKEFMPIFCPKVNVIERLEFKRAYNDVTV